MISVVVTAWCAWWFAAAWRTRPVGRVDRAARAERSRRAAPTPLPELASVADLTAVALSVGLTVVEAVELAAAHAPAGADAGLRRVTTALGRGVLLEDALANWSAADPGRAEVASLLSSGAVDGAAVAAELERLAQDLRRRHRRRVEARARQLPVKMLVPLVVCVLPAFVLVAVVPTVVVGLRGVARGP